jgi:phenylpropionate dioxygenase-like ring-hydroxylating dioxygenase large terminal subunit
MASRNEITAADLDRLIDLEHGRVHASAYTRSDIFDLELTDVFLSSWLFMGLSSEIPNPGDFRTLYLADVPVIFTRDDAGRIVVMLNRCPGCFSIVCQQEAGNASSYHCALHDWYFDRQGALSGFDLRLDRLTRVESYRGLVFACLSATAPGLQRHLGLARRYIDLWVDQSPTGEMEVSGGSWRSTYMGNWKLYLQSNGDGYRLEYLRHLARRDEPAPVYIDPETDPRRAYDLGNGHSFLETEAFDPDWRSKLPLIYIGALETRLGPDRTAQVLSFPDWRLQVFPNLCLTRHSLRVLRPIGVEETEVTQKLVMLPGAPDDLNRATMARATRTDGPAGHRSQDEFEMLERSQHGFRAGEAIDGPNAWVNVSRGLANERRGPAGERIDSIGSEVTVRAGLRRWATMLYAATEAATLEASLQAPLPPQEQGQA